MARTSGVLDPQLDRNCDRCCLDVVAVVVVLVVVGFSESVVGMECSMICLVVVVVACLVFEVLVIQCSVFL